MSSVLTNKTMVVVSRLGDFWVTGDQAAKLQAVMDDDTTASIELEGNIIKVTAIDGILTAEFYDIMNKKRRGGWQCKHQYWHERNEQCAHGQLVR